jgi:hypothetical protein
MQKSRWQEAGFTRAAARRHSRGALFVRRARYRIALGTLLATTIIFGCARQYHWYRCGCNCVNYNYCTPGPLPYTPYCGCPTPIANSYLRQVAQPGSGQVISEDQEEMQAPDGSAGQ